MFFYIDPGTGSMLFTVLIGILGAAIYAFRNVLVKAKFLVSGGKTKQKDMDRIPIVFFTDSKRYQNIFQPLCDEMEKRQIHVRYMTASPDDPLLSSDYQYIDTEFIGEGNKAYARMNFLKADIVLSSTPGLDVYQWKRSKGVKWYVHIPHMAGDITTYRMFGLDYYDAILVSGEFQIRQTRELEKLWGMPEKELVQVGLPQLDDLQRQLHEVEPAGSDKKGITVLLAPSWGPSSMFNRFGNRIIDAVIKCGYHTVIRPHPQSMVSEKDLIGRLMAQYPESDNLEWNFDNDNFSILHRSDILISDYSGVVFDFALVFDKPVVYADVSFDKGIYDAWWLDEELWKFETLPKIGVQLTQDNIDDIGNVIKEALCNPELRKGREQARKECWVNRGGSIAGMADYLENKVGQETERKKVSS